MEQEPASSSSQASHNKQKSKQGKMTKIEDGRRKKIIVQSFFVWKIALERSVDRQQES